MLTSLRFFHIVCTFLAVLIATHCLPTISSLAETRIYTLDPAESSITLSGSVTSQFGTAPIEQQGPGSLTTSFTGTIHADRTSSTIQFLSGGSIDASVSGNWQPLADASAGSAPADYGARVVFAIVVVNFAGRDLGANLTGASTTVDGSGSFNLANSIVNFTSGNIAYRANFGLSPGVESLAGNSGNLTGTAILTTEGMFEKLLLPVSATFNIPVDATTSAMLTLDGQLVATAPLPEDLVGDYNDDGIVDAADYVVWRKLEGTSTDLPNDPNPLPIDNDQYNTWAANFGNSNAGSGNLTSSETSAPEPGLIASITLMSLVGLARGRRPTRRIATSTID